MTEEDNQVIKYTVPEGIQNKRADKILAKYFTEFSRTQIQRTFDAERIRLAGRVVPRNVHVSEGDVLEIIFLHPKVSVLRPIDIPLDILYEDEDMIAINKEAGMVIHPGNATGENTLCHALLHYTKGKLALAGGEERPGVVHRLDKETSGVILFAKTDKAYLAFIKMFSDRTIEKEYLALVAGAPHLDSGCIKDPIGRNPSNRVKMAIDLKGREARTDWEIEERFTSCALLRCYPLTGRTHQIRLHLSHIKHPIIGDQTYGYRFRPEYIIEAPRVLLHAERIQFKHPISGEKMLIKAPLPQDFEDHLKVLRAP